MNGRLKRISALLISLILCLLTIPGVCEALPDSHIIYLYVPACESCARAEEILESLPESVTISHPGGQGESRVHVERIDVSQHPERAMQLFSDYEVPDDMRITPCVFFQDHYLSGIAAIEKDLLSMVNSGLAAGKIEFSEPAEDQAEAIPLVRAIGAGLIAGLNTCALSMLLLFLSLILETRKKAGLLAGCFLSAKFICYLLIGLVLLELMQKFNPYWLQPLAKWILTLMGCILISLNLWDAWQARRENFGNIRNQLPSKLRGKLHKIIRAVTQSGVLIPAVIALGFLVALGEFLCAGQLFLMQLLAEVHSGANRQIFHLVIYCLSFIAPSATLCTLVLAGQSHRRLSAFLANHMAAAKLATAAAMLILILSAWML